MKKRKLFLHGKTLSRLTLCGAALAVFASCAKDGFDDESFSSTVRNTELKSPEGITITPNADGSMQTIEWKVVHGATGYQVNLKDVTDAENPVVVVDSLLDGCSLNVKRAEDTNYELRITTIADKSLGNTDAKEASVKEFTTFKEALATIPTGDLAEYFSANPVPEEAAEEMVYYNLEPGQTYTLNGTVDFAGKKVALRTAAANKANIVYGENGKLVTYTGLTLKNLNIDCSAQTSSTASIVTLSTEPDEAIKGIQAEGEYTSSNYDIQDNIVMQGLNVKGLPGYIFFDGNSKAYGLRSLLIQDCVIEIIPSASHNVKDNALINSYKGYINDFVMKNTTVWQNPSAEGTAKYMLRYNNGGRPDRYGYVKGSMTYDHCTFYNVAKSGQWGNYDGIGNAHKWTAYKMLGCIFYDCGSGQIPRRFIRNAAGENDDITFQNNTYWFDGAPEKCGDGEDGSNFSYDHSQTQLQSDPGFANPASGDFTISGAEQVAKQTGDPRWIK